MELNLLQMILESFDKDNIFGSMIMSVVGLGTYYAGLRIRKRMFPTKPKIKDPHENEIFSYLRAIRKVHLENISILHHGEVYCSGRNIMFRKMLSIKLKLWEDKLREIIRLAKKEKKVNLVKLHSNAITDLIVAYNEEWRKEKIPEIVISKFNNWHNCHAESLIKTINISLSEGMFSSIDEQLNLLLVAHKLIVDRTIYDAKQTLGKLNGELSGLEYNGKILR